MQEALALRRRCPIVVYGVISCSMFGCAIEDWLCRAEPPEVGSLGCCEVFTATSMGFYADVAIHAPAQPDPHPKYRRSCCPTTSPPAPRCFYGEEDEYTHTSVGVSKLSCGLIESVLQGWSSPSFRLVCVVSAANADRE